jgi:Na+-transporting methylmalonyl-CoA/oxaloacetate decarboxylase gamma subunit
MQEMSYCNRCGANLKPLAAQAAAGPPTRLVGATWAISAAVALITLGGFGLIFAMVMALVTRGINLSEGGMALIFAALLAIVAIDWLLLRQLSRVIGRAQSANDAAANAEKRQLSEKPVAELNAPREAPLSSVTDHTTRTFEPIYRERDTQR